MNARSLIRAHVTAAVVAGLLAIPPTASARSNVDLLTDANVQIDGANDGDGAGFSAAPAGDVNADGRDDVIVGATATDNNSRANAGSAYVIYGSATPTTLDLDALTASQGFRIDGADVGHNAGGSTAAAGDVNGDGRDDIIIGASQAGNNSRMDSGSAYVIYGRASAPTSPVDLADTNGATAGTGVDPADGFRIDGADVNHNAGTSVAAAGDVNGDTRDDVIVGAPQAGPGAVYVIYGRPSGPAAPIDLADTNGAIAGTGVDPADGFSVSGATADDNLGVSVAAAGDHNGDGRDDVILTGNLSDHNGRTDSGSAYVIYGSAAPTNLDLNTLAASQGFRIDGANEGAGGDRIVSVAVAGDVDGDGRDDVIVGAEGADYNGRDGSGSAYVLYGRASAPTGPVDLADTNGASAGTGVDPAHGFRIDGAGVSDGAGISVAAAGEINGDSRDDVIVGAQAADNNSRTNSGSAYVIYGLATPTTLDLNTLTASGGFRIDGAADADFAGRSVAPAGDLNGDNTDDVIVGGRFADNNGRTNSGSAYVIYGVDESPGGPGPGTPGPGTSSPAQPAGPGQGPALTCAGAAATIVASPGQTITGTSGRDVIVGTAGGDRITGGDGNDLICGGGGNDRIGGGQGDDRMTGGEGNDVVSGGGGGDRVGGAAGDDRVGGGSGRDRLSGSSGRDRLSGRSGKDRLTGGTGRDRLVGGSGDDRLAGGSGGDRIFGGRGDDRLFGGSGNDRLEGAGQRRGKDRLAGGSGNDRISTADGERDRIRCGPGSDRLRADEEDRRSGCEAIN